MKENGINSFFRFLYGTTINTEDEAQYKYNSSCLVLLLLLTTEVHTPTHIGICNHRVV